MKYTKISTITLLIVAILFIPFYPVTIVPEWELIFLNKEKKPLPDIRINQSWKNYSLEYWDSSQHEEENIQSNRDGYLKLPERNINVSVFQLVSSPIRDLIMSIIPHASFGSDSYIVCQGKYACVVTYDDKIKQPQTVIVK